MWNSAKCSTWQKKYADGVAADAFEMGGDDVLYACAGAAYYAMIHGKAYHTKEEFCQFVKLHLGLDQDFLDQALKEIENK